jgi:hypothetical protein
MEHSLPRIMPKIRFSLVEVKFSISVSLSEVLRYARLGDTNMSDGSEG